MTSGSKVPARKSTFAVLAVALAALCWISPLRAQEHGGAATPPAPHSPIGTGASSGATTTHGGEEKAQGSHEGAPAGSNAPGAGTEAGGHGATNAPAHGEAPGTGAGSHTEGEGTHGATTGEAGHGTEGEHGAAAGHGEEGGHGEGAHEKPKFDIHLPTWLFGGLKQFWYAGPATITVAGAVYADAPGQALEPGTLKGESFAYTYTDHHSHVTPQPKYNTTATVNITGKQLPGKGVETEEVEIGGRRVILVAPAVAFERQSMLPEGLVISLITAVLVAIGMFLMTRNLTRVPNKRQVLAEMIYGALDGFVGGLIGPGYKRYVPLIAAAFIYIFMMNWGIIIPGWGAATANINVTAGLAIVIVAYVQYVGIRENGFKGYVMHFVGEPKWLFGLNVPIHLIGELAKILSLTIRLFGNIFGEDVVVVILISLALIFFKGFPIYAPMYLLVFFTSFVQAMVFSILTCVYIALMSHHDEEHEGGHGHSHDDHGHLHDTAAPATVA